jgi:hypothetical protein
MMARGDAGWLHLPVLESLSSEGRREVGRFVVAGAGSCVGKGLLSGQDGKLGE